MPFIYDGTSWGMNSTPWANSSAAWTALATGDAPVLTLQSDAGSGATFTLSGNRLSVRITITTGTSPVSGGILATLALVGHSYPPFCLASPQDDVSAVTFPYVSSTSSTCTLKVAGELEPGTTYSYDLLMVGA